MSPQTRATLAAALGLSAKDTSQRKRLLAALSITAEIVGAHKGIGAALDSPTRAERRAALTAIRDRASELFGALDELDLEDNAFTNDDCRMLNQLLLGLSVASARALDRIGRPTAAAAGRRIDRARRFTIGRLVVVYRRFAEDPSDDALCEFVRTALRAGSIAAPRTDRKLIELCRE